MWGQIKVPETGQDVCVGGGQIKVPFVLAHFTSLVKTLFFNKKKDAQYQGAKLIFSNFSFTFGLFQQDFYKLKS